MKSELQKKVLAGVDRRIYASEFRTMLGFGPTWFRLALKAGRITPGRRDVPNGRMWWTAREVAADIRKLNGAAVRDDFASGIAQHLKRRTGEAKVATKVATKRARP